MKSVSINRTGRLRGERGFTLVEMLVIVSIIVALAGVVVPSVAGFSGRGEVGAMAEEIESVQSAMDIMMVDRKVESVNTSPASSQNSWKTFPNGPGTASLDTYLKAQDTAFYYCWDSSGLTTDADQMAEIVARFMDKPEDEAKKVARESLTGLKRWQ